MDSEAPELAPNETVSLLIQEFGPLAAGGEQEKLIIEADGAWIDDVVILVCSCFPHRLLLNPCISTLQGVINLTTYCLAFHASLLSSRPDLSPDQQVIKAGPAMIHRKGWDKKLKVWLESPHDMLSSATTSITYARYVQYSVCD